MEPAQWDHDACGVGLLVDRRGRASHEWVTRALEALTRLTHRGASGDGHGSADGAGVLTAIPWSLLTPDLPAAYRDPAEIRAAGACFLPPGAEADARNAIREALEEEGWGQIAWRAVPADNSILAAAERSTCPTFCQVCAVHQASPQWTEARLEGSLYRARVAAEHQLLVRGISGAALVSLSMRTMVYKALVAPVDLAHFYPDLADARFETTFAVFHQRFSTNTFPQWALAQPFRVLAHNGEINTILGNRLQARRRQADCAAHLGVREDGGTLVRLAGSDSQSLDDQVDLLRQSGFSLAHAFARLLPRAWEHDTRMPARERAFEAYQSTACEPWEGPAAIAFADGRQAGAMLDRNGFRPLRVLTSRDGLVTVGSETGIFDIPERQVEHRGRLGPGEMLVVDLPSGRLIENAGMRRALAAQHPYREWLERTTVILPPDRDGAAESPATPPLPALRLLQRAFGYTAEELELIVRPMAEEGKEAVGSMGDDTPLAVLSGRRRLLPDYFRQRFAQVTNPPLDPLREHLVMSLRVVLGRGGRLLDESAADARLVECASPVLSEAQLTALHSLADRRVATIDTTFDIAGGAPAFADALSRVATEAVDLARQGHVIVVLSDRSTSADRAPLPALLVTSAAGQALERARMATRTALVVDSGEIRDAHQAASMLAFGAAALCPWLAMASAHALALKAGESPALSVGRYRQALEQGLLKVLSKMGVCTMAAYRGSHLMEAVGLDRLLLEQYFPDTPSVPGALTLAEIAAESVSWHRGAAAAISDVLPHPGFHGYRREGEYHAYNPAMVKAFHQAVDGGAPDAYARFTALVRDRPAVAVRDLLAFRPQTPMRLEEVEPVEHITRRFFASAMSVGALGPEAHRVLAIAMNRMGARSNSGEGGEEPDRFGAHHADSPNSFTKQVASGRFGVTPAYLLSATELQIKMAQGSKPGEGGQLPASKVVDHIARLRYAQPGTPLISPPPHHDIYSIEDLAQLIYDLRSLHPHARINVKLVSTSGVGIIAAGVVKAGAQAIQISGHDGGTGASPRGSIKHAGLPWEVGVLEAHRVLTARGSRHRVVLQTDGGLKTGHDVAMAAALGADEYGFGTGALVALGCLMARQCHLNTCPVGIASQRPDLRAKFSGTPEQVITYMTNVAEEVRGVLASLGLRSITELVGRLDLLQPRDSVPAGRLDTAALLSPLAHGAKLDAEQFPEHGPAGARTLNGRVAARARLAIGRYALEIGEEVRNTDRSVGATLAGLIAGEFGDAGVSGMPIRLNLTGHAGQSLGAFSVPGMEIHLVGDANDGVGKGMHGGLVTIRPPADTPLDEQVLAGNAVLYGATGGALFVAGRAGERFAVRNGGASAVVEGVGHHGCEYMTGGVVAVLGPTGLNFGAGMTGGIAYVYDPEAQLEKSINPELVDAGPLTTEDDARLLTLIMAHRDATGSRVAACLLADWPAHVPAFSVVRPKGSPARVQTSRAPLAGPTRVLAHRGAVAAEAGAAGHG